MYDNIKVPRIGVPVDAYDNADEQDFKCMKAYKDTKLVNPKVPWHVRQKRLEQLYQDKGKVHIEVKPDYTFLSNENIDKLVLRKWVFQYAVSLGLETGHNRWQWQLIGWPVPTIWLSK